MNHIFSCLKSPVMRSLQRKAHKKNSEIELINNTINNILPNELKNKYQIISFSNATLVLAIEPVWLNWLKSHEIQIITALVKSIIINKIKWRAAHNVDKKSIIPRHKIILSQNSAKIVTDTALSLKNKKLQQALLQLAKNSQK